MKPSSRLMPAQSKGMQYLFLLTAISLFATLVYFNSWSEPEWTCPVCPSPACGAPAYQSLPQLPQRAASWDQLRGFNRQLKTEDNDEEENPTTTTLVKSKPKPHYLLLAAILSSPKGFQDRQFLRNQSWISTLKEAGIDNAVKYKFVIGQIKTPTAKTDALEAQKLLDLQIAIKEEQSLYGDIVILDMVDDYHNLTLKLAKTLIWAHQQEEFTYDFMMKIDDDVWMNTERITQFLRNETLCCKTRQIIGKINSHARVIRNQEHRWGDQLYPSNEYAPYPNGPCYVLTRDVVGWLAAQHMSGVLACYRNEDVTLGAWVFGTTIILKNAVEFDMEGTGPSADCHKEKGSVVYHLSSMWGLDTDALKRVSRQSHIQFTTRWRECRQIREKYVLSMLGNSTAVPTMNEDVSKSESINEEAKRP